VQIEELGRHSAETRHSIAANYGERLYVRGFLQPSYVAIGSIQPRANVWTFASHSEAPMLPCGGRSTATNGDEAVFRIVKDVTVHCEDN
jgi:hypothetical protein